MFCDSLFQAYCTYFEFCSILVPNSNPFTSSSGAGDHAVTLFPSSSFILCTNTCLPSIVFTGKYIGNPTLLDDVAVAVNL